VTTKTAWRIVKAARVTEAFSGEGARRAGGRWNYPGTAMVYTAGSLALAALEVLVHLDGPQLLHSYVQIPVGFSAHLCRLLDLDALPEDWADNPAPESTKRIGTEWLTTQASVVLVVPSAIVPDEFVYLINPRHSAFTALRIGQPSGFRFDPRLVKALPTSP
jgi:RES domain-containing protein